MAVAKRILLSVLSCIFLSGCILPPPERRLYGVVAPAIVNPEVSEFVMLRSAEDFDLVRSNPKGSYKMMNDIDLSIYSSGSGWKPLPPFRGIFDGNGCKITNLKIISEEKFLVFFKSVSGGVVKNLTIENAEITGIETFQLQSIGIIAWRIDGSIIDNCNVSGVIKGFSGGGIANSMSDSIVSDSISNVSANIERGGGIADYVVKSRISSSCVYGDINGMFGFGGGIAGTMRNSIVEDSCYCGNITGYKYDKGSRPTGIAGISGVMDNSVIKNSFFTGSISGDIEQAGGIAGRTIQSKILDSYSTGDINVSFESAGGIGGLIRSTTVQNVYASGSVSADFDAGGIVGFFGSKGAATIKATEKPVYVLYPPPRPSPNYQQVYIFGGIAANKSITANRSSHRLIGNGVPTSLSSSGYHYAGKVKNSYSSAGIKGTFADDDLMLNGTLVPAMILDSKAFYENAGWKFGDSYDEPWVMPEKNDSIYRENMDGKSSNYPYLYWEDHADRRCVCPGRVKSGGV